MDTLAQLIHMANQIAKNLAREADPAAATAAHMKQFWDPRMLKRIREYAASGGDELSTVAQSAVTQLEAR